MASGGYAPEDREHLSLTLWPFYDWDDVLAATDTLPAPLGGVQVCVKSRRPHLGAWEDFEDLDIATRPCATSSETGEPIVLPAVPPDSELIVTATKEGYWPSVIAAVTGQWPTDATMFFPRNTLNRLLSRDSSWPPVGPALTETTGAVGVGLVGLDLYAGNNAALGGGRVALSPGPASGPFYSDGVQFDAGTTSTIPGSVLPFGSPLTEPDPIALFQRVAPDEHVIAMEHPYAWCRAVGSFAAHTAFGFPGLAINELRVPVLPGHFTGPILGECSCIRFDAGVEGPATCAPATASADAGSP